MPQIAARLENVSRLYGRFAALRSVSTTFAKGRTYLLLGENGAGKSTLLRILAGLLKPTSGQVWLNLMDERSPDATSSEQSAQRHRVGYMSHQSMLYDELSALENLRYFHSLYRGTERLAPGEALQSVGLDPELRRPIAQYSQGMRQRAALARVLLTRPRLLLLDEPFSNVDAATSERMLAILTTERNQGQTVVLTTHQRSLAMPIADSILTLEAGRLLAIEESGEKARESGSPTGSRPEPVTL